MEITRVLDNALRKAAAVWVAPEGHGPRLVWALWRDDAVLVAVGGTEQEVPGLADGVPCLLTVRSPSTHSHLVDVAATARLVEVDEGAAAALRSARLNATPRWDRVYRLEVA
ncbi:hypothetical protein [Saccharothrix algeriensis]|uniref:Pyridoxamine 5'-phosphate oxidase putative domain-containing protein n=1 Tax=Saccharothrix algeriensis TaxID=173560 RepID=A0ABS2S559_9PSEU|nr:hypothetical protein [Saccharothrix algeriensis]MBM7811383.1 hypothetical protein [Saccharothrix algeriensis]